MILGVKNRDCLSIFEKRLILSALNSNKIIAFPSDTIYGFGVCGNSKIAVENLYLLKHRNEEKPLILLTDTIDKIIPYIIGYNDDLKKMLSYYWPGPYTFILPYRENNTLYFALKHSSTLGVRIPNHPLLLDLLTYLPFPFVTTSANMSGLKPCEDGLEIELKLNTNQSNLSIILDEGKLLTYSPSAILEYKNGHLISLRKGECLSPNV